MAVDIGCGWTCIASIARTNGISFPLPRFKRGVFVQTLETGYISRPSWMWTCHWVSTPVRWPFSRDECSLHCPKHFVCPKDLVCEVVFEFVLERPSLSPRLSGPLSRAFFQSLPCSFGPRAQLQFVTQLVSQPVYYREKFWLGASSACHPSLVRSGAFIRWGTHEAEKITGPHIPKNTFYYQSPQGSPTKFSNLKEFLLIKTPTCSHGVGKLWQHSL